MAYVDPLIVLYDLLTYYFIGVFIIGGLALAASAFFGK